MSNRVDLTGLMERYCGVCAVLAAEHCDPWELEIIGRSLTDIARLMELQEIQEPDRRVCAPDLRNYENRPVLPAVRDD